MQLDIDNYKRAFPNYTPALWQASDGRWIGSFFIGNNYRRKVGYYGEFPPGLLDRIMVLLPNRGKVLHLFSGTVSRLDGISVDRNRALRPDVAADATFLPFNAQFKLIVADPPYRVEDARIYGLSRVPNGRLVLREARRVALPGAVLVWLDIRCPIWRSADWDLAGMISVFCGSNRFVRTLFFFEAA